MGPNFRGSIIRRFLQIFWKGTLHSMILLALPHGYSLVNLRCLFVFCGMLGLSSTVLSDNFSNYHDSDNLIKPFKAEPLSEDKLPGLVLPEEKKHQKSDKQLSRMPSLYVAGIQLLGNTILDQQTLTELISPYLQRNVSIDELHRLRYELSKHYFDLGYINSGILLPDQKIENGIVKFKVIEGDLNSIILSGNQHLSSGYIKKRIDRSIDKPLNVKNLQNTLRLLQQDANINHVQAKLEPTASLGEALLYLNVLEAPRYRISFDLNNANSPSVGEEGIDLNITANNLTGWGDSLVIAGGVTEGSDRQYYRYSIPASSRDDRVSLSYSTSDSLIIEDDFQDLGIDIDGSSESFSLEYLYPVVKRIDRQFNIVGGLDHRKNRIFILGQPGFFLGLEDGKSKTTSWRLGAEWVEKSLKDVFAFKVTYRQGVDALDATINEQNIPDGEYQAIVSQFQYARLIKDSPFSGKFVSNGAFQFSDEPLLSMEKFSVGGAQSVRGYRENLLVKDNGWYLNLEYHIPVFKNTFSQSKYGLNIVLFFDYGESWNNSIDAISGVTGKVEKNKESIRSAGLGFTWQPIENVSTQISYGHALDDIDSQDDSLQEDGIHFSINASWAIQ